MSRWTYVSGVIKVDTFARSSAEAIYLAQTVVNHLPQISGSEGPAHYYLNLMQGCCASSKCDEFNRRSNLCNNLIADRLNVLRQLEELPACAITIISTRRLGRMLACIMTRSNQSDAF